MVCIDFVRRWLGRGQLLGVMPARTERAHAFRDGRFAMQILAWMESLAQSLLLKHTGRCRCFGGCCGQAGRALGGNLLPLRRLQRGYLVAQKGGKVLPRLRTGRWT